MASKSVSRWIVSLAVICPCTAAPLGAQIYSDNFNRSNRPLDGWTVDNGAWNIVSNGLVAGPGAGATADDEQQVFMGDPVVPVQLYYTLSFDWTFQTAAPNRHAGVLFNWNRPGNRYSDDTTGYLVYWIDRQADHGFSLLRYDEGGFIAVLHQGTGDLFADPPAHVDVDVYDGVIYVYGDGVLAFAVDDETYRYGTVGLWTWGAANQRVTFDNFEVDGLLFHDDFERYDGSIFAGWSHIDGEWSATDGTLTAGGIEGTAEEQQAYARFAEYQFENELTQDYTVSLDWQFLTRGDNVIVGRHAGVMLNWDAPGNRYETTTSGYLVYWIDREADRGLNLVRFDGDQSTILHQGTDSLRDQPPAHLEVEVRGNRIFVRADGTQVINVSDTTYRGGRFGLWTWNHGQRVEFDNVRIRGTREEYVAPCFTISPRPYVFGRPIRFDSSCSIGEFQAYAWDLDVDRFTSCDEQAVDRTGIAVEHVFNDYSHGLEPTFFEIGLRLVDTTGASHCDRRSIRLGRLVTDLVEDFSRDGGLAWSRTQGTTWRFDENVLLAGGDTGTTEEHWIWAQDRDVHMLYEKYVAPPHVRFEYEYRFRTTPPGAVGRHGGFQFHCREPATRATFSGYYVDWIDRPADHGLRLSRQESGLTMRTWRAGGGLADPPAFFRVETHGEHIRVFGDGVLYFDVIDAMYRGGYFGFWTYGGGQLVEIDNLVVDGSELVPCFDADPTPAEAGSPVHFDAACSSVYAGDATIDTYRWTFGDGQSASGVAREHVYDEAGEYTVTLELRSADAPSASLERTITVAPDSGRGWQRPGDCTQDGRLDISDGICLLGFLFQGSPQALPCGDGRNTHAGNLALLDHNADGKIDLSDAVGIFGYLFLGAAPPALGSECVRIESCPDLCPVAR